MFDAGRPRSGGGGFVNRAACYRLVLCCSKNAAVCRRGHGGGGGGDLCVYISSVLGKVIHHGEVMDGLYRSCFHSAPPQTLLIPCELHPGGNSFSISGLTETTTLC